MADKVRTLKTFIVKRTYQFVVNAYDRDDALFKVADRVPEFSEIVDTKCGTPNQMKVTL